MPNSRSGQRRRDTLKAFALLLLPLVCCGLPVLIAAGALGGLGAALRSPWLIGTAAVLGVAGVARLLHRRHVAGRHGCRPPGRDGSTPPTNERSA
jgi:hypothetical protein